MIDNLDRNIGRLARELFLRGLEQNTIVIFASDNGGNEYEEPAGLRTVEHNAGLRGRKFTLWEGGVRVPLIVRRPGAIAKGLIYEQPALLLDLYATLADAAGATSHRPLDSVNLLPFLQGREGSPHNSIYSFITDTWSIREGNWKLISDRDSIFLREAPRGKPTFGLFNLARDPRERNNLLQAEPERARALRKLHEQIRTEFQPPLSEPKKPARQ